MYGDVMLARSWGELPASTSHSCVMCQLVHGIKVGGHPGAVTHAQWAPANVTGAGQAHLAQHLEVWMHDLAALVLTGAEERR